MNRGTLPHDDIYQEDGFWKLRRRADSPNLNRQSEKPISEPVWLGPAMGAGKLSEAEAHRIAWAAFNYFLSRPVPDVLAKQSEMTLAEFVEHKFAPEHVAAKRFSGRAHYQAILKHILTPEEVDRVFQVDASRSKTKLKTIPDWPYMGSLRLRDARPEHIQKLVSAALVRGYSPQTVTHIRNVVSAIFSHARKEECFTGENPASTVRVTDRPRRQDRPLTFAETKEALDAMEYPEREMTLIAVFAGLNVVEICGLQWKYVNLSMEKQEIDGEAIPATTIAVRKQWYRGDLGRVKNCRVRNVPIPQSLLQVLLKLRSREKFTSPDDFVLVSRTGTPVNQTNILERKLKPISKLVQVPTLSWHLFLRTRKALVAEFGQLFQFYLARLVHSGPEPEHIQKRNWHCRPQPRQSSFDSNRKDEGFAFSHTRQLN
jgi:integrase